MCLYDKGSVTPHGKDMLTLSSTHMIFSTASAKHVSSTASYASRTRAVPTCWERMHFMISSVGGNTSLICPSHHALTPTAPFVRSTFATMALSSCSRDPTASFRMRVWMM